MALRQPHKNFIAGLEASYIGADLLNDAGAVIADFVWETDIKSGKELCRDLKGPDLSFKTSFDAPAAFLTSIGLMLTA